jgi:hypothetical protein
MTRSIPNYVCVACGRGFTTKSAAKRHVMNLEKGKGFGYIVTEAQYRAALIIGAIPLPAQIENIKPTKKKDGLHDIAYRNFHSGFFWRLGELAAEGLTPEERKQHLATITMITASKSI